MKNILTLAIISILFGSCTKVVNINLEEADKKIVIEANVYNGEQPFLVNIKRSTDYYGRENELPINNAEVSISTDNGGYLPVPLIENGIYAIHSFSGLPGHTYALRVRVDGKEYTAQSTMPYNVTIDSLTYRYKDDGLGEAGYELSYRYTDPKDQENNYLMLLTVNDTLLSNPMYILLFNDKDVFSNAEGNNFYKRFKKGDKISVDLRGMDNNVYLYFKTLREILTNQNGPAPANPVTNIQGGALGYFGAFNTSRKEITIQ